MGKAAEVRYAHMKRGIALLMALVMALALTACTQTPPPNRGDVEGAAEPDAGASVCRPSAPAP